MYTRCFPLVLLLTLLVVHPADAQDAEKTYAERLGWGPKDRVVIFHCDDVGMSHDSNRGAFASVEKGVVTSWSVMMPCAWVVETNNYLKEHPEVDSGLHLTLTSEWGKYRWPPLSGASQTPGLVDEEGCLWRSVQQVVQHASADEVEQEIRAQIKRARDMGMPITHLDSHMGTLFASPAFLAKYVSVGIEENIPVMIMGGHMTHIAKMRGDAAKALKAMGIAEQVWEAGLPVLDDLHTGIAGNTGDEIAANMVTFLKELKPGVTEVIVHCTQPSETFREISSSGGKRLAELEAVCHPDVRRTIEEEGIILTTWREMKERRDRVK